MQYKADGTIETLFYQVKQFLTDLITIESSQFSTGTAPAYNFAQALFTSCVNIIEYIDASLEYIGVNTASNLAAVLDSYTLSLSATDQTTLSNRVSGFANYLNLIETTSAVTIGDITGLGDGVVVVSNPGFIAARASNLYNGAALESSPTPTTTDIPAYLQTEADGWGRIYTALTQSGIAYNTQVLDLITRMQEATQNQYNLFAATQDALLENSLLTQGADFVWDCLGAMPVISSTASFYWNTLSNPFLQKVLILKYALMKTKLYCAQTIYEDRSQVARISESTILRSGETLMDVANRALGDYAKWTQLVAVNGLVPPYVSTVSSPGVLSPGDKVFLPSASGQAVNSGATYEKNFLGADLDLGEIDDDMSAWSGDIQTVSGLKNFGRSIERRVRTLTGTLIYHNFYGCQSPNLVGQPITNLSGQMILAYVRAAILSDPRTAQILNISLNSTSPTAVGIVSTIQPKGPGSALGLDLVLQPPPPNS